MTDIAAERVDDGEHKHVATSVRASVRSRRERPVELRGEIPVKPRDSKHVRCPRHVRWRPHHSHAVILSLVNQRLDDIKLRSPDLQVTQS